MGLANAGKSPPDGDCSQPNTGPEEIIVQRRSGQVFPSFIILLRVAATKGLTSQPYVNQRLCLTALPMIQVPQTATSITVAPDRSARGSAAGMIQATVNAKVANTIG